jgi:hypothetical protein
VSIEIDSMSFNIIRDIKVDTLSTSRGFSLPVTKKDTNYARCRLIFSEDDGLLSYTDGTQWIDVPSSVDITQLTTDIANLTTQVNNNSTSITILATYINNNTTSINNIENNSGIVLTSSQPTTFPNGCVITAGTAMSVNAAPGLVTLNVAPSYTSGVELFCISDNTGKKLDCFWSFTKIDRMVLASFPTVFSIGLPAAAFQSYVGDGADAIPIGFRPNANLTFPIKSNPGGGADAIAYLSVTPTGAFTITRDGGVLWPQTPNDTIVGSTFSWITV